MYLMFIVNSKNYTKQQGSLIITFLRSYSTFRYWKWEGLRRVICILIPLRPFLKRKKKFNSSTIAFKKKIPNHNPKLMQKVLKGICTRTHLGGKKSFLRPLKMTNFAKLKIIMCSVKHDIYKQIPQHALLFYTKF